MTRDTLERAIKKGSGQTDEAVNFEVMTYEGFGPHKVPVVVECLTDNRNRTAPEIRHLFKDGVLGQPGSMAFFFDRLGVVEGTHADKTRDAEGDAIEAGAQNVEPLEAEEIPEGCLGALHLALGDPAWRHIQHESHPHVLAARQKSRHDLHQDADAVVGPQELHFKSGGRSFCDGFVAHLGHRLVITGRRDRVPRHTTAMAVLARVAQKIDPCLVGIHEAICGIPEKDRQPAVVENPAEQCLAFARRSCRVPSRALQHLFCMPGKTRQEGACG